MLPHNTRLIETIKQLLADFAEKLRLPASAIYDQLDPATLPPADAPGVPYAGAEHDHDDRYMTDAEIALLLDTKADTEHDHDASDVISGTLAIARLPVATSGTSSTTQIVRADDSRLSNARTALAHAASHASAGSDPISPASIGAAATTHSHAASDTTSGTFAIERLPVAASGSGSPGTIVSSLDLRLSDKRQPTNHASTHATGGTDPITPQQIGAAETSHIHDTATAVLAGFMSAANYSKLLQLTIASGKSLTTNAILTLAGLDGATLTIPASGTAALLGTAQTFSQPQRFDARAGIGADALSNVQLNIGGTLSVNGAVFGMYMGGLTMAPAAAANAFFGYFGGGTIATTAGAIGNVYGIYVETIQRSGAGSVAASYGMRVGKSTTAAANYGAQIDGPVGIGRTPGITGDGDLDIAGRTRAATFETSAGNKWQLGGHTAGALSATGYITVTIDGVQRRLLVG